MLDLAHKIGMEATFKAMEPLRASVVARARRLQEAWAQQARLDHSPAIPNYAGVTMAELALAGRLVRSRDGLVQRADLWSLRAGTAMYSTDFMHLDLNFVRTDPFAALSTEPGATIPPQAQEMKIVHAGPTTGNMARVAMDTVSRLTGIAPRGEKRPRPNGNGSPPGIHKRPKPVRHSPHSTALPHYP